MTEHWANDGTTVTAKTQRGVGSTLRNDKAVLIVLAKLKYLHATFGSIWSNRICALVSWRLAKEPPLAHAHSGRQQYWNYFLGYPKVVDPHQT